MYFKFHFAVGIFKLSCLANPTGAVSRVKGDIPISLLDRSSACNSMAGTQHK